MRKYTGNLHKEAKALPSSKGRPNKVRLRSTLEEKKIFLGNQSIWKEEPNVSSQLPSSVESGSRSQPQLKFSPGQISQACPH